VAEFELWEEQHSKRKRDKARDEYMKSQRGEFGQGRGGRYVRAKRKRKSGFVDDEAMEDCDY